MHAISDEQVWKVPRVLCEGVRGCTLAWWVTAAIHQHYWIPGKLALFLVAFLVWTVLLMLGPSRMWCWPHHWSQGWLQLSQWFCWHGCHSESTDGFWPRKPKESRPQRLLKSPSSYHVRSSTCMSSQHHCPIRASSPMSVWALIGALTCSSAISTFIVLNAPSTASKKWAFPSWGLGSAAGWWLSVRSSCWSHGGLSGPRGAQTRVGGCQGSSCIPGTSVRHTHWRPAGQTCCTSGS